MEKKTSSDNSDLTDTTIQKGGGHYQRSRELMVKAFGITGAHLSIYLSRSILHPNTDGAKGAAKFAELMIVFLEIKQQADNAPRFIWLVPDLKQLQHVLCYMRDHDKKEINDAFEKLVRYTIIAVRGSNSPYNMMLASIAQSGEALTASPTSEGDFSYLRHFSPSSDDDWQDGPLCEPLVSVPDELNDLSHNLLAAHGEKLSNKPGTAMEHLRKSKVSVFRITEILAVFVLFFLHVKDVTSFYIT